MNNGKPLPCGCIRGSYLCAEAEQLWRASSDAWRVGDYPNYARLRQEYEDHFRVVEAQQQEATR